MERVETPSSVRRLDRPAETREVGGQPFAVVVVRVDNQDARRFAGRQLVRLKPLTLSDVLTSWRMARHRSLLAPRQDRIIRAASCQQPTCETSLVLTLGVAP